MIGTIPLRSPPSCSSSLLLESVDVPHPRPPRSAAFYVVCNARGSSSSSSSSIPKLDPFNRSRIDRLIKEPPFIQKSENDLTEYCSVLEGDESYSCWRAYFELKDLEKELPREDVEKFLRQAGGRKTLIDCLHGITAMEQRAKSKMAKTPPLPSEEKRRARQCPVPDGLPKTKEELEEEESARMPDSPFTRLLRSKGKHPAWYSHPPDHETD